MSLKWVHIFFISVAAIVGAGFGLWGLLNDYLLLGILSLVATAGLVAYGKYFLRKARKIGLPDV